MDAAQSQAVHDLILEIIDDNADPDGMVRLEHVVETIQHRLGATELFPKGRLTSYVRYTKTDMEARCEIGTDVSRVRRCHGGEQRMKLVAATFLAAVATVSRSTESRSSSRVGIRVVELVLGEVPISCRS
jgi:hypothetical protein